MAEENTEVIQKALGTLQKRAYQNKLAHKFNVTDLNLEFCVLYGEVAEAYDAWNKETGEVGEELADVAIYLLGLAEILGVDLGAVILGKMDKNEKRIYPRRKSTRGAKLS